MDAIYSQVQNKNKILVLIQSAVDSVTPNNSFLLPGYFSHHELSSRKVYEIQFIMSFIISFFSFVQFITPTAFSRIEINENLQELNLLNVKTKIIIEQYFDKSALSVAVNHFCFSLLRVRR